jgi:hypothetical protein
MIFKGGTIRVVSPVREGGNRVRVDPNTGQNMYKEEFFPLSAKRELDRLNRSLPNHLKKKIEVVSDGDVRPTQIQQHVQQVVTTGPVVKKRGPKPKNHGQAN